jgi:hypothetical protein
MGPREVKDVQGMGMATLMLERSLAKGRTEATLQCDSVRKWRSAHARSLWHASANATETSVAIRGVGKMATSTAPTNAPWFERFMEGMHKRMGDKSEPDLAISIEVVLELLSRLELGVVRRRASQITEIEVLMAGVFVAVGFCGGLRGEETMLMDVCGMRKHGMEGLSHKVPHTVVALLGKFKGEMGQRYHYYMPMARVTRSEIKLDFWVNEILSWYDRKGIHGGPIMRNRDGTRLKGSEMGRTVLPRLKMIQFDRPDLIGPGIDVDEEFGMGRSIRRGSNSQAINAGLRKEVIDRNNRWRKVERAKGRNPRLEMQEHYADARLIIGALVEYSQAL